MEYPERTTKIFVSYSHEDEDLLKVLLRHLSPLRRHLGLETWTDRDLVPGEKWDDAIRRQLDAADLVLLLISASFLDSDFCYEIEMQRALQRHSAGTAILIPIILRPCFWRLAPFAEFQVLPKGGEPITQQGDLDQAMTDVVEGIERVLSASTSNSADENPEPPPELTRLVSAWPSKSGSSEARSELITQDLELAYSQRESLVEAKADTTAIDLRIRDLKHQLRGPQLSPGHFFADGRFQLVHTIGQGGFATVWLAQDRQEDQPVAVKVLHGQFNNSEERRERLFRGARQMAKLDHPHIVKVLSEPATEDGWAYFVMEYLEGGDFRRAVLDGRLDVEQRLDVLEKVALAIDHAHG